MREASRRVLWQSVANTVELLRSLYGKGLMGKMPVGVYVTLFQCHNESLFDALLTLDIRVVCVFIPLTIHYLYIKTGVRCDPAFLTDLSLCTSCLQCLCERYDLGDFILEIIGSSLSLAHDELASSNERAPAQALPRDTSRLRPSGKSGLERLLEKPPEPTLLPPPGLHAAVIRFQNRSLASGSATYRIGRHGPSASGTEYVQ